MSSHTSDKPICKLSFHGDWTPLNRVFFSQCIQDSDEERSFYSQRKKWKRKRHPYRNGKKYIVYEYVSSESEVSASDEYSSADNYERNIKSKSISDEPGINASDEYVDSHYEERVKIKRVFYYNESCSEYEVHMSDELNSANEQDRNIKRHISDKPKINLSEEYDDSHLSDEYDDSHLSDEYDDPHYEGRVNIDDDKSCSEPEIHMSDELNSAGEQKETVKIDDDKSCSEPEVHMSDELNSADEQEGRVRIDDDKSYSEPEVHMSDELNSTDEQEEKKRSERLFDERRSFSDSDVNVPDQHNLSDENENNMHFKKSAVKDKKYTANRNESSDEWEMPSSNSSDECEMPSSNSSDECEMPSSNSSDECEMPSSNSSDECEMPSSNSSDECEMRTNISNDYYDSSDSSDDYEVAAKKKKTQKSQKRSKKNVKNLKPKSPQLSEYEKMVQKNRDEKVALMKSLKLFEAKENFEEAVKTLKPKTGQKEQKNKRKVFRNLENGLIEEVDEKTKTKAHEEIVKVCRQSARQKNLLKKKEEEKETFASSRSYNEIPSVLSFKEALKKGHVYHDFISEVSGSEFKIPQLLDNDYVSHFEKMSLQESQVISFGVISSMVVHESPEKIIICAGNVNGEIIFWHVNSDYDVCAFQPHLQRVSCLKFNPYSTNVLISSSVDGTMYHGDFEKKIFYQIFKAKSCNHFDFLSPTSYLVAHGIKYVSVIDIRTHRKTFEKRHKCNEDAVKTVSLHPINKNYFISAHQKGAVRLWDLRKLQNEPVIEVYCKGENLISSSFSPVTGNSLLVTMSDTICLHDSSSLNKEFKLKKSIEHDNFPTCWTPFQATWLPNTDDTFIVGSRLNPRRVEIFDDKLCNFFNLTDERFNHIAPVNAFHSSLPFLASASRQRIFIFSESE